MVAPVRLSRKTSRSRQIGELYFLYEEWGSLVQSILASSGSVASWYWLER